MSKRQRLGLLSLAGLLALGVLVIVVPVGRVVGAGLFMVVLVLLGIVFFRFNPHGDAWVVAQEARINPWLYVLIILALAMAFFIFRYALLQWV